MQSYHSGWYTIFVLNKINLIESFKEYSIDLKDILNFFKAFGNKASLLGTFGLYCSLLLLNRFIFCFRFSFTHAPHCLTFTVHYIHSLLTRSLSLKWSLSLTRSPINHSTGRLTFKMKLPICFIGVWNNCNNECPMFRCSSLIS